MSVKTRQISAKLHAIYFIYLFIDRASAFST